MSLKGKENSSERRKQTENRKETRYRIKPRSISGWAILRKKGGIEKADLGAFLNKNMLTTILGSNCLPLHTQSLFFFNLRKKTGFQKRRKKEKGGKREKTFLRQFLVQSIHFTIRPPSQGKGGGGQGALKSVCPSVLNYPSVHIVAACAYVSASVYFKKPCKFFFVLSFRWKKRGIKGNTLKSSFCVRVFCKI